MYSPSSPHSFHFGKYLLEVCNTPLMSLDACYNTALISRQVMIVKNLLVHLSCLVFSSFYFISVSIHVDLFFFIVRPVFSCLSQFVHVLPSFIRNDMTDLKIYFLACICWSFSLPIFSRSCVFVGAKQFT